MIYSLVTWVVVLLLFTVGTAAPTIVTEQVVWVAPVGNNCACQSSLFWIYFAASQHLQVDLFIGLKWSNYSWNHVSFLQRTPSLSRHSNRPPSVADSMAEYFDASEVIVCETSSEAEASDESGLSDITTTSTSEPEEGHCEYLLSNKSPLHDFLCHNKG